MNSRERVLAVFDGKSPDRIPWGEWSVDCNVVEAALGRPTYYRAKAQSRIALWEGRRAEVVGSWKRDPVDFFREFDCLDVITLADATWDAGEAGSVPERPEQLDATTWRTRDGRLYKYSEATRDLTCVEDPAEWTRPFRAEDFPLPGEPGWKEPTAPHPSRFEVVDAILAEFGASRFVAGPCGGEAGLPFFGGMQRGMIELLENPELVERMVRHDTARQCRADAFMIRPGQSGVRWGSDFAFNSGPFISPEHFRRFVVPYARERIRSVTARGQRVVKHSCGNNRALLPLFLEAGYPSYQSIQASAGMDLEEVRRAVGPDMVLWGNVPLEVLQLGTPEDVRQAVRRTVEKGKRVGRYIFGSSHSIAVGTPYDNFLAMADEFVKVRDY